MLSPHHRVANEGDLVIFQCQGRNIEWTFDWASLRPDINIAIKTTTDQSSLAIIVHGDSYYGQYRCDGEDYKLLKHSPNSRTYTYMRLSGFYETGTLKKLG